MAKLGEAWVELKSKLAMDWSAAMGAAKRALGNLGSVGTAALGGIARAVGLSAFQGLSGMFDSALAKAESFSKATNQLAATLLSVRGSSSQTAAGLQKYAAGMAESHGFTTAETGAALQYASAHGVAADKLRGMLEMAVAVSSRNGDLAGSTAAVTALYNNQPDAIKGILNEYQNYPDAITIINHLEGRHNELLEAGKVRSEGMAGATSRLRNETDKLLARLGAAMLPVLKAVLPLLKVLPAILGAVAVGLAVAAVAAFPMIAAITALVAIFPAAIAGMMKLGDAAGESFGRMIGWGGEVVDKAKAMGDIQRGVGRMSDEQVKAAQAVQDAEEKAAEASRKAFIAANPAAAAENAIIKKADADRWAAIQAADLANKNAKVTASFTDVADVARTAALRVLEAGGEQFTTPGGGAQAIAGVKLGESAMGINEATPILQDMRKSLELLARAQTSEGNPAGYRS